MLIAILGCQLLFSGAASARTCVADQLRKSGSRAESVSSGFGIMIRDGKVIGRNGDPVVAAFDLDETLVRSIRTTEGARALRRIPGRHVVSINANGAKAHYEVFPGMLDLIQDLQARGIRVTIYSAGDPQRNQALLKAIRLPKTNETLFSHLKGRLVPRSEIRYNLDPLDSRPDILKPLRSLGHEAAGMNGPALERAWRAHADLHNAFIMDDLKGTSIHQIWIPSPSVGGPPYEWAQRREYVLGLFSEAVDLAVRNPGMSLGSALKRVQNVNLLDPSQWAANPLIQRGRSVLGR